MSNRGKIEGLIRVPSGGWPIDANDSGGAFVATIPAGDYYMSSPDTDADNFVDEVADQLNASGTDAWTVTASLGEGGTGKVTIDCSATFSVTWDTASDAVKELLGFAANISSASSPTAGANHARSVWLPPVPPRNQFGENTSGKIVSTGRGQIAPDGTFTGIVGPKRRENALAWMFCKRSKVLRAEESTANESFEKWWLDQMAGEGEWSAEVAGRLRWYPDADVDGTYFTYAAPDDLEGFDPPQSFHGYNSHFDVSLRRLVVQS